MLAAYYVDLTLEILYFLGGNVAAWCCVLCASGCVVTQHELVSWVPFCQGACGV